MGDLVLTSDAKFVLVHGDALENMAKIPDGYIDLISVDLPYGLTRNKWDISIPLEEMWKQFNRITKPNGAMIFTAAQPFAAQLIVSNLANFKYDIIWEKTVASGQLNSGHQPLRVHESILVFYRKVPTYNEQLTEGTPYKIKRPAQYGKAEEGRNNYNQQKSHEKDNDGYRHARSVIKISNPRVRDGHPTQKPVELMSYIIKTYTNKHEIVLDCTMGSGTTGVACAELNRRFIGIDTDEKWYNSSVTRLTEIYSRSDIGELSDLTRDTD
jgi:site-specific DNA-methyltransferase (adenine-specific)